jgi:hypothetical protein
MAIHSTLPSTPYAAGTMRAATLEATLSHAVLMLRGTTPIVGARKINILDLIR